MRFNSILVDLATSAANDLLNTGVQNEVVKFLRDSDVKAVGIDVCCKSWTRARRGPEGSAYPRQLRDDTKHLLSVLPRLAASDRLLVKQGNAMLAISVRVIRLCLRLGIKGYLENPRTSRI